MGILSTLLGTESWDGHTAKLHLLVVEPPNKETFIGKQSSRVTRIGRVMRSPAMRDSSLDMGEWQDSAYVVQEGTILKLFGFKSGRFLSRITQASMYFKMRDGAALRQVGMRLSSYERATHNIASIAGRFDLLSPEQLVEQGVVIPRHLLFLTEPRHIGDVFSTNIVEPELVPIAPLVTTIVENAEGEPVRVQQRRHIRTFQFKK